MKKAAKTVTIGSISKKVMNEEIVLKHKLQRREGVWSKPDKSLLIDSVLRDYVVPDVYIVVDPETNKKHVIDGVQRLSTLRDFLNNKFTLSSNLDSVVIDGVEYDISKKRFSKLDEKVQETIKDFNFVEYEISDYTDKEVRDMFSRLNSGKPLNSIQKLIVKMNNEIIDNLIMLSNNPVFDDGKLISTAQLKSSNDIAIILETLMLIYTVKSQEKNYDFLSFRKKDKENFIQYLNENFNEDVIMKLDDALTDLDKFIEENENVKLPRTSIQMIIYAIYKVKKDHKSVEKLLTKVKEFIDNYDKNEEYKSNIMSGTSGRESVTYRYKYWRNIANSL